jgi:hypothetical protein
MQVFKPRIKPKGPAEEVAAEEVKEEAAPALTGPEAREGMLDMAMATLALTPMETITPKDTTLTRIRCEAPACWNGCCCSDSYCTLLGCCIFLWERVS